MMIASIFIFCLLLLPIAVAADSQNGTMKAPVYIAAVGDSLTEGFGVDPEDAYPALLIAQLNNGKYNCFIQNFGISGEMSSQTLARIYTILQTKPDLLLLETGINDALNEIPIETIRSNISEIVELAQAEGIAVILLGVHHIWSWDKGYASDFNSLYEEIARRYELLLIPSILEGVAAKPDMTLADTIHPNERGYRQVVKNILPTALQWFDTYSSASGSSSSLPR